MRTPSLVQAASRLGRALLATASTANCPLTILSVQSRPWSSATFVGAQHRLAVAVPDTDAARAWLATLPEAEFHLPGLLVADLAVRPAGTGWEIEVLLLDEA